jgi:hypothetical protein
VTDIRKAVAEHIGQITLANIELNAQLQAALAEIDRLKAAKEEKNDDSK